MVAFAYRPYDDIINGTAKESGIRNEDGFNDTKASLRGEHKSEISAELPMNRRHQVQWIDKSDTLLSSREEQVKAKIMTSMMVLQMCEMAAAYGENIFEAVKPDSKTRNGTLLGSGALYFRGLQNNVGWTAENPADEEDVMAMLIMARKFIGQTIYVGGDSRKGFKYKDEAQGKQDHAFASIEGLDISRYLKISSDVIHLCTDRIDHRNAVKLVNDLEGVETRKQEMAKLEREAEEARLAKLNPQQPSILGRVYSSLPGIPFWTQTSDNAQKGIEHEVEQKLDSNSLTS